MATEFTIPDVTIPKVTTGNFKGKVKEIHIYPNIKQVYIKIDIGYDVTGTFTQFEEKSKGIVLNNADYDSFMTAFKADISAIDNFIVTNWG